MVSLDIVARTFNQLPDGTQERLERTWIHDRLRRAVVERETFTKLRISPNPEFSFEVLVPERFRPWWIHFDPDAEHSSHEPPTTEAFIDIVDEGDVVWDMGSQFGYFTFLAAARNESPGDVHVFEMSPYKCRRIERATRQYFGESAPRIVQAEVGDGTGDTITGTEYRRRTTAPDLIKLDIEGAEAAVLPALSGLIEDCRPSLVVEVHPNKIAEYFDGTEEDIWDVVADRYDDIAVCTEFRTEEGTWEHDVDVDELLERRSGQTVDHHGGIDPDSYQLRCTP